MKTVFEFVSRLCVRMAKTVFVYQFLFKIILKMYVLLAIIYVFDVFIEFDNFIDLIFLALFQLQ